MSSTALCLNGFLQESSPSHGHSVVQGNSAALHEQRPEHKEIEQ